MAFKFRKLAIPEVILIKPEPIADGRGFFVEVYKHSEFAKFGIKDIFVQSNQSKSERKGTIRGLHFQKDPAAQAKLIQVISGSILDVAVDIRKNSPTYGKWVSSPLSKKGIQWLYIPVGFAHGFCTLEDNTEILYKCSKEYSPENDRGIIWNDKFLNIEWPLKDPVLSQRDRNWPSLEKADNNFI
ncbi:MAG: dTDP-4-dehydrorhamnose 3,5-epimerase [Candidatus Omnitrophica bacterium]|nr:dTDP-4-dehydrorhamnose 3,5-epimerase [Candidatus Omnitrophota bacterium]MDD5430578.1 dTDP-4-dehydrorhamnose 3,5-epimerase [Candidatus Omnitrophota bacterium]